ncbi:hypothetical protein ASPNIDRAFT_133560, partial [Aspergillus niger ATCC 1015]
MSLFSKKVAYLSYVALFEVGRLICALAPSSPVLIVRRAIAGLGASGIIPGGLARSLDWNPNWTLAIASIVRPTLGGALTQHVKWRWCSYINLPITEFSAVVVLLFFHVQRAPRESIPLTKKLQSLDGVGFFLFLPIVISDVLISIIVAGLVNKVGKWNPFLILVIATVSLAGGLLTTLHPPIFDGHRIGFQISGGIGYFLIVTMVSLHC